MGNRSASHRSTTYGYQTGQFNQLASTATATYGFDANGNTTTKSEGSQFWRYTWDGENRLTQASTRKDFVRYKYDALGRRVQRTVGYGKESTKFIYDGTDIIADDNAGTLTKYQNGVGIDNKLRVQTGTEIKYFLADHLGSTNGMMDPTGAITASTAYDSFGNPTNTNFPSRYQFTGREYDTFSGFYYYRARSYDANIGRFISEDPIGMDGGDINLFAYVRNDPSGLQDSLGLYPTESLDDSCDIRRNRFPDPNGLPEPNFAKDHDGHNPWVGAEVGGNGHLVYAGGGGSAGVEFNVLTGEICFYTKTTGRLGLGAYIGGGIKFNAGLGPYSRGTGEEPIGELGLDVAFKTGGKAQMKGGQFVKIPVKQYDISGSAGRDGLGFGVGPVAGAGISVGVDFGVKKVWCFNTPKDKKCNCN